MQGAYIGRNACAMTTKYPHHGYRCPSREVERFDVRQRPVLSGENSIRTLNRKGIALAGVLRSQSWEIHRWKQNSGHSVEGQKCKLLHIMSRCCDIFHSILINRHGRRRRARKVTTVGSSLSKRFKLDLILPETERSAPF
jgi:hypothetical protein